jgi:hypothetical protein
MFLLGSGRPRIVYLMIMEAIFNAVTALIAGIGCSYGYVTL